MENNSGNTLKIIAVILGILGVIGSIVLGIVVGNNTYIDGLGFGVFVGTALSSFLSALMLYGFGELIDNSAQINTRMAKTEKQLDEIKARLDAAPDAAPAAPQAVPAAPQAAPAPAAKPAAAKPKEAARRQEVDLGIMDQYEKLGSATEIYGHFRKINEGNKDENVIAMTAILKRVASNEDGIVSNYKFNAISVLKSYYKHGGHVFAADRSQNKFRCPVCDNELFSDRKSCHHCGALFRD